MISWLRRRLASLRSTVRDTPQQGGRDYAAWIAQYDVLSAADKRAIRTLVRDAPLVSVLLHRGDGDSARTIQSVREQIYPKVEIIESNRGLAEARGAFVIWVEAGDVLAPHTLATLYLGLQDTGAAFAYSDEDAIAPDGARGCPYFKSDWNATLFLSQDFACRAALAPRASLDSAIDGRRTVDAAAWCELLLHAASTGAKPIHSPYVLYHRRAVNEAVQPALDDVVQRHLAKQSGDQTPPQVTRTPNGARRIVWPIPKAAPLVSLMVPTRDNAEVLRTCIEGLRDETDYPNLEILILDNDSVEAETLHYFDSLASDQRVRIIKTPGAFNFSAINNAGARAARGDIIGLINNDLKIMEPHWLTEMVSHACRPNVGAVGAMLYYGDGRVQHAGCIVGIGGVAAHIYKLAPPDLPGHGGRMQAAQEMSAVTAACLLTPRHVWAQLNGLEEGLAVAYNDVDYCLRVRKAGYDVDWTPFARLYHLESATRGADKSGERKERLNREKAEMARRWGAVLQEDPFYSPNLDMKSTDCRPAFPPRTSPPWRQTR